MEGNILPERIALVTDSACDLDRDTISRHGIRVLPLQVIFKDGQYRDGVDITAEEVYARMGQELPSTSLPTPAEAKDLLLSLARDGFSHVLAIHLSSGLSGTYEMMSSVAKEVPGVEVEVVDSKILAMGLGLIVRQAGRWLEQNLGFHEVVRRVRDLAPRVKGYFTLKTLEYLKQGGRIGTVQATIGEILSLKPVISIDENGKYFPYAKIRGRQRSLDRLYEIALGYLEKGRHTIAVLQGDALDEATRVMDRIQSHPNASEVLLRPISPALVVHTGPGLVGLVIMPEQA